MPKKLLATTILTAILVLVIGVQVVEVEANFFPGDVLIIYSPISRKGLHKYFCSTKYFS
jgi:hypothetical protein